MVLHKAVKIARAHLRNYIESGRVERRKSARGDIAAHVGSPRGGLTRNVRLDLIFNLLQLVDASLGSSRTK